MVRAVPMSDEQIEELIGKAREDKALWEALKDRETAKFNPDGSEKEPTIHGLIEGLVRAKYGRDHTLNIGSLMIQLRRHIRLELGLPV